MKQMHGNLITLAEQGYFEVIVQGCNCLHKQKKGLAKEISERYPGAVLADNETKYGDRAKLGTYSQYDTGKGFIILNGYTQFDRRRDPHAYDEVHIDYNAVRNLFRLIKQNFSGKRIGYPLIGAGLAGGDWNIIKDLIEQELAGEDHTLAIHTPPAIELPMPVF